MHKVAKLAEAELAKGLSCKAPGKQRDLLRIAKREIKNAENHLRHG